MGLRTQAKELMGLLEAQAVVSARALAGRLRPTAGRQRELQKEAGSPSSTQKGLLQSQRQAHLHFAIANDQDGKGALGATVEPGVQGETAGRMQG
jgi:hypothetical protein